MSESTHRVEVVPVCLEAHPNADSLSIVKVFGYTVCVRTEDWKDRTVGAYIPPDSVVPDEPWYRFLAPKCGVCNGIALPCGACFDTGHGPLRDKDRRIKAKKLRGIWSQGMLVPAPPTAVVGDDVAAELNITHYDPLAAKGSSATYAGGGKLKYSDQAKPPALICGVYDIENWYRYGHTFEHGEKIVITEKIHGANFRAVWHDGKLHVGSHKLWKNPTYPIIRNSRIANKIKAISNKLLGTHFALNETREANDWWWTAARQWNLADLLIKWPDWVFYGEVYGPAVQDLTYGVDEKSLGLVFYDVRNGLDGTWEQYDNARAIVASCGLKFVPELYTGEYCEDVVRKHIDGNSILAANLGAKKQIREGIVIQSREERFDRTVGRMKLKAVSPAYLERA